MKATKGIVLCVIVFTQSAKSQNNNHQYYLEGQFCSGLQQNCFVSGIGGAFGFYISNNQSIDFRAKEIYNFSDKNVIGVLNFNYRYHFKNGVFIGGGFAHHHEISGIHYIEQPAEAALGSHPQMRHRSGLSAEIGYSFKAISKTGFFNCVYPTANLMGTYMILDKGLNPLITANVGIRIGLKRW